MGRGSNSCSELLSLSAPPREASHPGAVAVPGPTNSASGTSKSTNQETIKQQEQTGGRGCGNNVGKPPMSTADALSHILRDPSEQPGGNLPSEPSRLAIVPRRGSLEQYGNPPPPRPLGIDARPNHWNQQREAKINGKISNNNNAVLPQATPIQAEVVQEEEQQQAVLAGKMSEMEDKIREMDRMRRELENLMEKVENSNKLDEASPIVVAEVIEPGNTNNSDIKDKEDENEEGLDVYNLNHTEDPPPPSPQAEDEVGTKPAKPTTTAAVPPKEDLEQRLRLAGGLVSNFDSELPIQRTTSDNAAQSSDSCCNIL